MDSIRFKLRFAAFLAQCLRQFQSHVTCDQEVLEALKVAELAVLKWRLETGVAYGYFTLPEFDEN